MTKEWYVIHTYSGYENKVKASLEERFTHSGVREKLGQVVIPTEEVVEIRGGKKKITSRKFFPGYVLIQVEMDQDIWYLVKNTPKVTGFLGGRGRPMHQVATVFAALQQHKLVFLAQLRQRLGKMNCVFADAPARVVGYTGVDTDAHRGRSLVLRHIVSPRSRPNEKISCAQIKTSIPGRNGLDGGNAACQRRHYTMGASAGQVQPSGSSAPSISSIRRLVSMPPPKPVRLPFLPRTR